MCFDRSRFSRGELHVLLDFLAKKSQLILFLSVIIKNDIHHKLSLIVLVKMKLEFENNRKIILKSRVVYSAECLLKARVSWEWRAANILNSLKRL